MNTVIKTVLAASFMAVAPSLTIAEEKPVAGASILGVDVKVESVVATGYSAFQLIGSKVENDKGQKIGRVHDLIISTDGQVNLAIIEVGGFLGVGSKLVAIPASLFEPGKDDDVILSGATEEQLKNMSPFHYAG